MARATPPQDALALLTDDHKAVKALFNQFKQLAEEEDADEQKAAIAEQICNELTVHAQIEEEIFYPAVRAAIDAADLMDEAEVEHQTLKELVGQIETIEPGDELFDAKVTVLGEYVDHHVKEEQDEIFPKVRKSDLQLRDLGAALAQRKEELKADMGIADEPPAAPVPPGSKRGTGRTSGARARR